MIVSRPPDPELRLDSFLRLGFFLGRQPEWSFALSDVDPTAHLAVPEPELRRRVADLFRNAVASRFPAGRQHVIPISGGLDSRALLGAVLECTPASNIETCTFGTPGTYDFDLGCALARRVGTSHTRYPLTDQTVEEDELVEASRRIRHQTILFHHAPLRRMDEAFGDHVVWSGFLGDKLAKAPSELSDERANEQFLAKNTFVRSADLTRQVDDAITALLAIPEAERSHLPLLEELNLRFRQTLYIAPHVLPLGFDYRTPFTDPELVRFMLCLPLSLRMKSRFYTRFLLEAYPHLFDIGWKANEGLPRQACATAVALRRNIRRLRRRLRDRMGVPYLDPTLNYLDFDLAFRERPDLRKIVRSSLSDLRQRQLVDWIDLESLEKRHLDGTRNHADALIVLTSLELHLKASGGSPEALLGSEKVGSLCARYEACAPPRDNGEK